MMRDETKGRDTPSSLWVNTDAHILSFVEVEGFKRKYFSTCDKMMDHALRLSRSGYRIQ